MNLDDQTLHFKEAGYNIFRSLHARCLLDRMRNVTEELLLDRNGKIVIGGLIERYPDQICPILMNPILLSFAERVMGPFVQLDGLTLVAMPPPAGRCLAENDIHWHRDPWSHVPLGVYEHPLAINMLTYLQDGARESGPLRVLPRSHVDPIIIPTVSRRLPHADEILIETQMGDVVVTHNGLVHSRSPNLSNSPRAYISTYLNRTWLRQSTLHDGPVARAIQMDAMERNDRRILRLFGLDTELQTRTNSG